MSAKRVSNKARISRKRESHWNCFVFNNGSWLDVWISNVVPKQSYFNSPIRLALMNVKGFRQTDRWLHNSENCKSP